MAGVNVAANNANEAYAITTSDTGPNAFSYLYCGGAGDIVVTPERGSTDVTLKAVPVGTWVWLRTSKVKATGTTATNLVGFK